MKNAKRGLLYRERTPTVHSTQYTVHTQKGVTLIELLMVIVISAIAMMALAVPLVAERAFLGSGQAQAESQRDGEMALRAMAHGARQSSACNITPLGATNTQVQFVGGLRCFKGGPDYPAAGGGELHLFDESCTGSGGIAILIDGNRSKVEEMTVSEPINNKLVRVHLRVSHRPINLPPVLDNAERVEDEVLDTEIFLRNGS